MPNVLQGCFPANMSPAWLRCLQCSSWPSSDNKQTQCKVKQFWSVFQALPLCIHPQLYQDHPLTVCFFYDVRSFCIILYHFAPSVHASSNVLWRTFGIAVRRFHVVESRFLLVVCVFFFLLSLQKPPTGDWPPPHSSLVAAKAETKMPQKVSNI